MHLEVAVALVHEAIFEGEPLLLELGLGAEIGDSRVKKATELVRQVRFAVARAAAEGR